MQIEIPYMQIRGGSSKGLFFRAEDLPSDELERNNMLLLAMEGCLEGDSRQIDGLGGATQLTSKVAIVRKSDVAGCDLDYLFVQVMVGKGQVATNQTCGNLLAGVLHFAIENKIIPAQSPVTHARINLVNTGGICEIEVLTPEGEIQITGEAKVDGVPGTAAPIICNYLDTQGSTCQSLFPTGHLQDRYLGISCTCIDNGMPVILMRAADFGLSGYESILELEADTVLKEKIEQIRLKAGIDMNLGDVTGQSIPKICLIAPPIHGGIVHTRMLIPHRVHEAIGVLAAVSVATACIYSGTVCDGPAMVQENQKQLAVEHPSGELMVSLDYIAKNNTIALIKSGVIRTARILSKGAVYIPKL